MYKTSTDFNVVSLAGPIFSEFFKLANITMRWSHQSSFFIFAVLIAAEVALSAPINVDLDVLLEARSPVTTREQSKKAQKKYHPPVTRSQTRAHADPPAPPADHDQPKASTSKASTSKASTSKASTSKVKADDDKFKAEDFKMSSDAYRKNTKVALHRTGTDGFVESDTGKKLAPGEHAGEHFEYPKLLRIDTERFDEDHFHEAQTLAKELNDKGHRRR